MPHSVEAVLDEDGHLRFSEPVDARRAGHVRVTFLEDEASKAKSSEGESDEGHVTAHTPEDSLRTAVEAGGFPLTADEPASVEGGTGEGPTPYDLLGAALASCTTMTLQMYARRKDWPLEEAGARVEHEKIHAADCAHCDTEEGKIDRFTRTIRLAGPLSDEQRQRLVEIAERCPVHQTLEGAVDIMTLEEEGEERRNGGEDEREREKN